MSEKFLHIIAFDIPYPPNYGGVIDIFYKIKYLSRSGIKIYLHIFEYQGRNRANELKQYCEAVYYYPRLMGFCKILSFKPYIVNTRKSKLLLERLLKDTHPILFEGLHCCYYIDNKQLKNRMLIYRESNIEHDYYYNLSKSEKVIVNKIYYLIEAVKLYFFQSKLRFSNLMLAVSMSDYLYLNKRFKASRIEFMPSFHKNEFVDIKVGKGNYALYHGNIEVPENKAIAYYLIDKVFSQIDYKLIIAGMNPPRSVVKAAESCKNVEIIANPNDETLETLIKEAQVNINITFQATGLKLKLLNSLYIGRYCIVNNKMIAGTGLDELCEKANTTEELINKICLIKDKSFGTLDILKREEYLKKTFSNIENINLLNSLIF